MTKERLMILQMVEDKKITAEDAITLLNALGDDVHQALRIPPGRTSQLNRRKRPRMKRRTWKQRMKMKKTWKMKAMKFTIIITCLQSPPCLKFPRYRKLRSQKSGFRILPSRKSRYHGFIYRICHAQQSMSGQ